MPALVAPIRTTGLSATQEEPVTDSAPVTDDREVLTHNHIPEYLVARSRHSDGKIQLGEIR